MQLNVCFFGKNYPARELGYKMISAIILELLAV